MPVIEQDHLFDRQTQVSNSGLPCRELNVSQARHFADHKLIINLTRRSDLKLFVGFNCRNQGVNRTYLILNP